MSDKSEAPTIVLTLVNPSTMELHIGGKIPNVDVGLAMLSSAIRQFENQWQQLVAIKIAQQMQDQAIAESLMSTSPPKRMQ